MIADVNASAVELYAMLSDVNTTAEAASDTNETERMEAIYDWEISNRSNWDAAYDWGDWSKLTQQLGGETIIVGDDLTVTDLDRVKKAITQKAANGIIIKPNQVGTITETLEVVKEVKKANFKIIVSHRSGETNDDFIADFAVGVHSDYAKFGAPARGERVAKYNRLLEIEHELS